MKAKEGSKHKRMKENKAAAYIYSPPFLAKMEEMQTTPSAANGAK